MSELSLSLRSLTRRLGALGLFVALACAAPLASFAQEPAGDAKELSEKVNEALGKLKPLLDAKNWDGAIALVDEALKLAKPGGSYDEASLQDIKAKIYLQKPDFPKAIGPMERTLKISEQHPGYFDDNYKNELAKILTQIYYQDALTPGRTKEQQSAALTKAAEYIKRVIDFSKGKPSPDDVLLYAGALYNKATLNQEKIDQALVSQAQKALESALPLAIKPKKEIYNFLTAIYGQQANYERLAETLELLLKRYPSPGSGDNQNWQQLFAVYLALAADDKNKDKAMDYNVRAILAAERAQAAGTMKTPKDNFNLITIYFQINQFDQACEMLEAGLKNGTVDQDQKNWELLAAYYQQVNKESKAIDVLKTASARYPKAGALDFQAAQIYYSIDKLEDAYRESKSAVAKGSLGDREGQIWSFLAYCAFELQKLDEALQAVEKAGSLKGSERDKQLPQLKAAIENAIKDREQNQAAMKARQKAA